MKKELFAILMLLGLPTIFIMSFGGYEPTGHATNGLAELRAERIQLYLDFPVTSKIHKQTVYRIRQGLLAGAKHDFYSPYGLASGEDYFYNERTLYKELLKLMCLRNNGYITEGTYVSPGGITVTIPAEWQLEFEDLGQIKCDPTISAKAEKTLLDLIFIDTQLVKQTIDKSTCKQGEDSLERARQNTILGDYEAVINNLRAAWNKAQC